MRWRCFSQRARLAATSGRARSLATNVFFKTQPLLMHESPHGGVIRLQAALFQFADWPGATLPVSRKRRTQPIAVLTTMLKRFAAARHDSPSTITAPTMRSPRSSEKGFAIQAGRLTGENDESDLLAQGIPIPDST